MSDTMLCGLPRNRLFWAALGTIGCLATSLWFWGLP